jgi:hypothetical protein
MKSAQQLYIQALGHFRDSVNSASTKPHVKGSSSELDVIGHDNNQLNQLAKQLEDDDDKSEGGTKNKIRGGKCITEKIKLTTVDNIDGKNAVGG